jgi:hypothetical protein
MSQSTIERPSTQAVPLQESSSSGHRGIILKVLLGCGVLSSVLYIGAEWYAWTLFPGYSPISHAFSELLAEGAPTRAFMVTVSGAPYNLLVAALGVGVWMSGPKRATRIAAVLLMLYALTSYLGGTVFQMDPRGTEGSVRTMNHERATAVMVVSMLLTMTFGSFMHGKWFRLYSLGTLVTVLLFSALACQQAALLSANEPAPWLGVIERVAIYAWMLWVAVLSLSLWPDRKSRVLG